jgi:hypothetical protein
MTYHGDEKKSLRKETYLTKTGERQIGALLNFLYDLMIPATVCGHLAWANRFRSHLLLITENDGQGWEYQEI